MVIRECVLKASDILKKSGIETSRLDAGVLMCKVLEKDNVYVAVNGDKSLSDADEERYFSFVHRRALSEPVAYIVGEKEFMSLNFFVNENVLIPRPDTEHLVELAIELIRKNGFSQVADFCTGSGAIAVSIAKECKDAQITGIDISIDALEVAEKNKIRHGTKNVRFMQADVLNDLSSLGKYDIVVSNPPYVSKEEMKHLDRDVGDFEPHLALYGGNDGLDFYRRMAHSADEFLEKDGVLAFEVGHKQSEDVAELMGNKFKNIQIKKDYGDVERVVWGVLKA